MNTELKSPPVASLPEPFPVTSLPLPLPGPSVLCESPPSCPSPLAPPTVLDIRSSSSSSVGGLSPRFSFDRLSDPRGSRIVSLKYCVRNSIQLVPLSLLLHLYP